MSLFAKVNGTWQAVPDAEKVFVKVAGAWNVIGTDLPDYNDASGGTVTTYTTGGRWFRVHTFTADGTFTVNTVSAKPFRTLVCPGGGGGGVAMNANGGGKGRGGKPVVSDATVLTVGDYPVKVGGGGGRAPDQDWGAGGGGGTSSLGDISAGGGGGGGGGESPYTGDAYSQNANIEAAYNDPATWVSSDITGTVAKYGHDGAWGGPQYEGPNGSGPGGGGRGGGNGWGNRGNPTAGNAGTVIVSYEIPTPIYNDATGGTITEATRPNGEVWRTHRFAAGSSTFTVNLNPQPFTAILSGGARGGMSSACCGSCASPMQSGGTWTSDAVTLAPGDYPVVIGSGGGGGPWPAPCTGGNCSPNAGAPGGNSTFSGQTAEGGKDGVNGPAVTSDIEGTSKQYVALSHGGGCGDHVNGGRGDDGFLYVSYRIG